MNFRTELEALKPTPFFTSSTRVLTIGSCFSEVIGNKLTDLKLSCFNNPFGTLFNPVSIFKLLHASLDGQPANPSFFVEKEGIWNHYDFHSKFWATSPDELSNQLNEQFLKTKKALRTYDVLIITLGTSVVYQLKRNKQVVANCHKQPSVAFEQSIVCTKEIVQRFQHFYDKLQLVNSKMKIIVTVSPVRHTKDTLQLNSVSKSMLRAACFELEKTYEKVTYFPSFEIMMDDLRDYRFYKPDMIHPTEQAEEYIFEKFRDAFFSAELREIFQHWVKLKTALNHRPIQENSPAHQKFLLRLLNDLNEMNQKINVKNEIEHVKKQLDEVYQ